MNKVRILILGGTIWCVWVCVCVCVCVCGWVTLITVGFGSYRMELKVILSVKFKLMYFVNSFISDRYYRTHIGSIETHSGFFA